MNTNTNIMPIDFQQIDGNLNSPDKTPIEIALESPLPQIDTVGHVLNGYAPLGLMLCCQINFESGKEMMRRLNHDAKTRTGKTEQDIHPDKSALDEFASVLPEDKAPMELAKTAGLVAASVMLASHLQVDDTSAWMKKHPFIRTPRQIIEDQVSWIADQQAESRRAQATRFGLELEAAEIRAKMEGETKERANNLYAEVRSAIDINGMKAMSFEELLAYIEDAYDFVANWDDLLKDRITGLFDRNVKKLKSGGYADMDDVLIALAQSFQKK